MYIIGGVILAALGIFMLMKPESFYKITQGWKNAEDTAPSRAYIFNTRFGGILCLLAGVLGDIILLFFA